LISGRLLSEVELAGASPVCLLSRAAAIELFGGVSESLGRTIRLPGGRPVRVVGVVTRASSGSRPLDAFGYRRDHLLGPLVEQMLRYAGAILPAEFEAVTSQMSVMLPHKLLPAVSPKLLLVGAEPRALVSIRDRLQGLLAERGYEPLIYMNAALPVLYGETLKLLMQLNRVVFVLCLLVGSTIVAALMCLDVVDRRREIAIRRVEGARRWQIMLQFVIETCVVCVVGGVVGLPLGLALAALRCALEPLELVTWAVPWWETVLVLACVLLVGLASGLLPAYRAAAVEPLEVLRNE
jgi:hypothetical protein